MKRKDLMGLSLPALGLGCMRFPTDGDGKIKLASVRETVELAMANGVNYFDTGYDYHGGMSEAVIAELLKNYDRDSYYIADKFPGYDPSQWRRAEAIFEEQLSRCSLEYFDFYLLHNVSESSIGAYLGKRYGIIEYLLKEKAAGRIRHFGFSAHGSPETLKRLLDEYGSVFEFAQIQLNYVDYEFQHAKEKIKLLSEYGLPIFVMEPLRGGRLARLKHPFDFRISRLFPDMSAHEAAFKFIQGIPEVKLTLSGMSSPEELADNIGIFSSERMLTEAERQSLIELAREMTAVGTVPCTSCRYCTEHCPAKLDIPRLLEYYNEHSFSGGGFIVPSAVASMRRNERPTACMGCKSCEQFCPQGIHISEVMAELCDKLGLR